MDSCPTPAYSPEVIGADRAAARPGSGDRLEIETDRLTSKPERVELPPFALEHELPPRSRVLAGVTALVVVLGASILLAVFLVVALRQDQTQLHSRNVPYASAIAEASLWAKSVANDERGYLITGDRTFVLQIDRRVGEVRRAFVEAQRAADGEAQLRLLDQAAAGFEQWHALLRSELALFDADKEKAATELSLGRGRELRKEYETALGAAQRLADGAVASTTQSVASASDRSVAILLALLVVALGAGFAVAAWLMHTIVRPAYNLLGLFGDAARPTQPFVPQRRADA
jgi:methyl-accepting chemotaxis protein